jgi:hypothetical protein
MSYTAPVPRCLCQEDVIAPAPDTCRWSHEWKIAGPGSYQLLVTGTDERDRAQPAERPSERVDEFEQNQRQSIQVTVT